MPSQVELRTPEKHVGGLLNEITGPKRGSVLQLGQPSVGDTRQLVSAEVGGYELEAGIC